MKTTLLSAASIAVLLAVTAAASAADAPKLTPAVQNALAAASKAANAKDYKTASDNLAKAKAVDGRKPYDDLKIAEISLAVDIGQGDMAAADVDAEAAADAVIATPEVPDTERLPVLSNGLALALNAQHNDKALAYAKALEPTATDPKTLGLIAKTYYMKADYAGTVTASKKAIDAATAAHVQADRSLYIILASAQSNLKDNDSASATLEASVRAFNNPNDWTQLIDLSLSDKTSRDLDYVYLGRLLLATKAAITPDQANVIGETASRLTFYGDALAMKAAGGSKFPDPTAKANADKAKSAQNIADAAKEKNGLLAAKVAQALYSYGMFDQAIAEAQLAVTKGGDPDTSEPQIVIAQSLAGQGKYQDAIAAFQKVQGGTHATARAVQLWTLYCNVMLAPPAQTAAAAQ